MSSSSESHGTHDLNTPTDNLEAGAGDLVERYALFEATLTELQSICSDFGVKGGEKRTDGIRRVLTEQAAQLAAVTAENARLREAIADLNVTDQELVRIHNMCTGFDGDVKIWAKMLHKLAVFALAARTALSQEAPK